MSVFLVNERGYLYVLDVLDVLSIARCTGSQYAFAEMRPFLIIEN